jgi:hypothetical protein
MTLARHHASIDVRDLEKNVVTIRFRDGRPDHARHLAEYSFVRQSLSKSCRHSLVIQWLAQAELALLAH